MPFLVDFFKNLESADTVNDAVASTDNGHSFSTDPTPFSRHVLS